MVNWLIPANELHANIFPRSSPNPFLPLLSQSNSFRTLCVPVSWHTADNVWDLTRRRAEGEWLVRTSHGAAAFLPLTWLDVWSSAAWKSQRPPRDTFGQNCIFTARPFGTLIPLMCPSSCTGIGFCLGVYMSPSIAAALLGFSCWAEL